MALGRLFERAGAYQSALNAYGEAMQLAKLMADNLLQVNILGGIVWVYRSMGDIESARQQDEQALALFRQAGIRMGEADVLLSLGELDLTSGDLDAAFDRFRQALSLSEDLQNPFLKALALRFIGLTHRARAEPQEALVYAERALSTLADQDRKLEGLIRVDMADAHLALSEADQAREEYVRARELSRTSADRLGESTALYGLARASILQGDLAPGETTPPGGPPLDRGPAFRGR